MSDLQKFDAEIEKTRQTVEEMRTKLDQSGVLLENLERMEKSLPIISQKQVKEFQKEAKSKGYKGAFVVAFKNEKKISVKDALASK